MGYFLGLDGGNTKTHITLYNPDTGLLDLYTGGPSNYEMMPGGYAELSQVLKGMLDDFLGKHGITPADIGRAGFGMAGVDTPNQHKEISKVLQDLGFADISLENDGILGIKAAASRGYGISCVSGTGYSVLGLARNGETLQIGGMSSITGDKGGGGHVMAEGVSYVYGQLFRRYAPSMLTEMFMKHFEIAHKNDFMEAMHVKYYNGDTKAFTLAVSKMVFEAAGKGDAAAINILTESAISYGESVIGILDNLTFEPDTLEIVLNGSLFQKNPKSVLVTALATYVKEHYGQKFALKVLDAPNVLGALIWAIDKNGEGLVSEEKRVELGKQLNGILEHPRP